jgi:hypothetical protein
MRRCAGRSYSSHSHEKSSDMVGARLMTRASRPSIQPHTGIGRGSVWACRVRTTFSPNPAYSDGKRTSRCSHVTLSTGRPLPARSRWLVSLQAACSLCRAYGMHASRRQQQACVWNAAAVSTCARYHCNRCDLIETTAPNDFRLQLVAMLRACHAASTDKPHRLARTVTALAAPAQ